MPMNENFKNDLIELPISFVTSKWIIDRIPFVFTEDRELYIQWKEKLSEIIEVDSKAMVFTGSSTCGFSLNPNKNYKLFDHESDIDIAIISQHYFDVSWHYLRNLKSELTSFTPKQRNSIKEHVNRLIYWGTIATDQILEILPFGKKWSLGLIKMGNEPPFEGRVVNIRIYKDLESLRFYQTQGLNKLKNELLKF